MKVVATIEARMASTRLPGKVMFPLGGKPMLEQLILRVQKCEELDKVCLLTSTRPENRILLELARQLNIPAFAGSEDDVLDRLLKGTERENADVIVQLTGDNPAIDPELIDEVVCHHLENGCDYTSNYLTQNVIIGQNLRCFNRAALVKSDTLCDDKKMRAHGGYYIQQRPDIFKISEVMVAPKFIRDDIRLTVDEPEDYAVMNSLFETLGRNGEIFCLNQIIDFFDSNPKIKMSNSVIKQKSPGEG